MNSLKDRPVCSLCFWVELLDSHVQHCYHLNNYTIPGAAVMLCPVRDKPIKYFCVDCVVTCVKKRSQSVMAGRGWR